MSAESPLPNNDRFCTFNRCYEALELQKIETLVIGVIIELPLLKDNWSGFLTFQSVL